MTAESTPPLDAEADAAGGELAGVDFTLRRWLTPVVLTAGVLMVVAAWVNAASGERLGGFASLMVLTVATGTALKLAAETYLFSSIGGDPTPRQRAAKRLVGELAGWAKLRYALGAFGGVIFPLGAQILAAGAKNIPPVLDAGPPAIVATLALVCLVPAELLERWLCRETLVTGSGGEAA